MFEIKKKLLTGLTFIDLFAGIGGFHLALASLGAKCTYANEWDPYAKQTYQTNFSMVPDDDITKVELDAIPNHDILCAGFPCQAFSISGKQLGFNDKRGTLFFEVAKIIKNKHPKIVLMENVKNLLHHNNGNTFNVIKNTMQTLGYDFYYQVLNAKDFGIPQNRERLYMVGFAKELNIHDFKFPLPVKLKKHVVDLLEPKNKINPKYFAAYSDLQLNNKIDLSTKDKVVKIGIVNRGGQGERIYSPYGVGITLSAYGGGRFAKTGGYYINQQVRKLTTRECARIMGFPDSFKMVCSDQQTYKQFGNAVVVDVLQYIAIEIANVYLKSKAKINY